MPDSAAAKAKIKAGDRIIKFNDEEVSDVEHLRTLIAGHAAGDTVQITLDREGMTETLEVELAAAAAKDKPANKPELPFKLPTPRGRQ